MARLAFLNNIGSRQKLEDLVEYVMNYGKQNNFRVFIFLDQRKEDERTRE